MKGKWQLVASALMGSLLMGTGIFYADEITTETTIQTEESTQVSSETSKELNTMETTESSEQLEIEPDRQKSVIESTITKVNQYATVTKQNEPIWENIEISETKRTTSDLFQQTVLIQEIVTLPNGEEYVLVQKENSRLGYVARNAVTFTDNQGGMYFSVNQYGTMIKKNYTLWNNLNFSRKKGNSTPIFQNTFLIKGEYHHYNGSTYYSVYDNQNVWQGYINASAVKMGSSRGGAYIGRGQYGTITKKNYTLWNNFNFSKKRGNSTPMYQKTYLIKGEYHHINGSIYYSVYDNKNHWLGYINKNGMQEASGQQGIALKGNKKVVMSRSNYSVWQNFNWKKKNTANKLRQQEFTAKIYYHHFNGATYYSLYNNKNHWTGYINQSGTKEMVKKNGLTYVDNILIVNKKYPVPSTYNPGENNEAGRKIRSLINDMRKSGYNISTGYSGFRSYTTQQGLYNNYVRQSGKRQADTFSARPGYSEHQTGLAFDLIDKNGNLVTSSREATWIQNNAHKYGFIVRYQKGKESITGYQAEPWHLRYVGNKATSIRDSKQTLEEYLSVLGGSY